MFDAAAAQANAGLHAYAELLATVGVERGLIGPREVDRLWDRHIMNCAVVTDPALGLVPDSASVTDVGSGAGLPGLVWALVRPDITVVMVEPLLRRSTFLSETIEQLGLTDRVTVLRARAEDLASSWPGSDVVTARAVAPLAKLVGWTLPLAKPGGALVALKGASAADEIKDAGPTITKLGGEAPEIVLCGAGVIDPVTTVVKVIRRSTR